MQEAVVINCTYPSALSSPPPLLQYPILLGMRTPRVQRGFHHLLRLGALWLVLPAFLIPERVVAIATTTHDTVGPGDRGEKYDRRHSAIKLCESAGSIASHNYFRSLSAPSNPIRRSRGAETTTVNVTYRSPSIPCCGTLNCSRKVASRRAPPGSSLMEDEGLFQMPRYV